MRLGNKKPIFFIRYKKRKKSGSIKPYIFLAILFGLIFYCVVAFEKNIKPIVLSVGKSRAEYLVASCINQAITDVIVSSELKYEHLMTFQKNNAGEITAIQANVVKMNELKSSIALNIYERIKNIDSAQINTPIGFFFGNSVLAGWGPRIPIRLIPSSATKIDFRSEFQTSGINQTSHQIYIDVTDNMTIMLPTVQSSTQVSTSVAVAQTIIVGNVPQSYTNIEGASGNTQDIVLETAQ